MAIKEETCVISPPKFGITDFYIEGIAQFQIGRAHV